MSPASNPCSAGSPDPNGDSDDRFSLGLDHIGVIVRDLDAGAACWRRLGFTLTPRSPQMGLDPSGQRFEPWATANHCAVLEAGYLELIGVHRPELHNPWSEYLNRFEGPHIAALRCNSADQTYAVLSARTEDFAPPVQRRRDAPYRDEIREMRFRNIFSRDERVPECRYIVIEHQTPEVLWEASVMQHANGALGLVSITLCASPTTALTERWQALSNYPAYFRPGPQNDGVTPGATAELRRLPDKAQFRGGRFMERVTPDDLVARFPGVVAPPGPALVACQLAVKSIGETRAWLESQSIPYGTGRTGGAGGVDTTGGPGDYDAIPDSHPLAGEGIWVHPDYANGCVIEFVPHRAPSAGNSGGR